MGKLAFTTQIVSERAFITKSKMAGGPEKPYTGCIETPSKKKKPAVFKSGCGSEVGALTLDTGRPGSIPTNVIFFSPDFFTPERGIKLGRV